MEKWLSDTFIFQKKWTHVDGSPVPFGHVIKRKSQWWKTLSEVNSFIFQKWVAYKQLIHILYGAVVQNCGTPKGPLGKPEWSKMYRLSNDDHWSRQFGSIPYSMFIWGSAILDNHGWPPYIYISLYTVDRPKKCSNGPVKTKIHPLGIHCSCGCFFWQVDPTQSPLCNTHAQLTLLTYSLGCSAIPQQLAGWRCFFLASHFFNIKKRLMADVTGDHLNSFCP